MPVKVLTLLTSPICAAAVWTGIAGARTAAFDFFAQPDSKETVERAAAMNTGISKRRALDCKLFPPDGDVPIGTFL